MAVQSAQPAAFSPRRVGRTLAVLAAAVAVVLLVFALLVWILSGVSLATDASALARLDTKPLAGSVRGVSARGADGRRIPLRISNGRLTPLARLRPGEAVSIVVRVRRPGWLAWALGSEKVEHLTVRAPVAEVAERWLTVTRGRSVQVSYRTPVVAVAWGGTGHMRQRSLAAPSRTISLGPRTATGTIEVAAAARPWETLGASTQVSWFPPSREAVLATLPSPGTDTAPAGPIYLTFSKTVAEVLGGARPRVSPATPGVWREPNSHTLVFTPAGFGAAMGSQLKLVLPRPVAITAGTGLRSTSELAWTVPPGSPLRLQQLLAEAGYLPVDWTPTGAPVAHTPSAEVQAAVDPPAGAFGWRYPDTPAQLERLWEPGTANEVVRGAVMKFESLHEMTADGVAGPQVWSALLRGAVAGARLAEPYSYVYVHREVPETMTLWSAGRTVLASPANTGITGAETALGTYPVFEHIPEGTMSGTNPDGSHYQDPGIKWISYFNGGDALHNFDRASFGTPQSLGCVELPLAAAAEVWKYTPIGTLVTIET
jgi:hypothetical protein